MLGRGVPLAIGFLTLCVASSAEAQGNLDQGKTAAELSRRLGLSRDWTPPSS
jgi:hypothetical protein